ncbi:hypothetical protein [Parapedobacter sp. 2B3]|uniref:hypothetical protein n=1 Tax=Parapedobacter sp. 2B3 TaxID=3342381 RepID=UPI0035B652F1
MNQYTQTGCIPPWLSLLRRGTAIVLLAAFVAVWADYAQLYNAPWLRQPIGAPFAATLPVAYTLLCLPLLLGYAPRLAAALLLVLHHMAFIQPGQFTYGFDHVAIMALFYCATIPPRPNTRWPLRMVQVSLCIIYTSAGVAKAIGPTWWTGEALWKAATLPGFEGPLAPLVHRLGGLRLLWVVGGWAVIAIEALYPVAIWFRRTRRPWCWLTIGLHGSIALVMGLYAFSALMILLNIAAFALPYRQPGQRLQGTPMHRLFTLRLRPPRATPSRGNAAAHRPSRLHV